MLTFATICFAHQEMRNVLRAKLAAQCARNHKAKQSQSSGRGADGGSLAGAEILSAVLLARDKCIPVVQGLVRLLLAMDFTCHVDLFLVTCKVRFFNLISNDCSFVHFVSFEL